MILLLDTIKVLILLRIVYIIMFFFLALLQLIKMSGLVLVLMLIILNFKIFGYIIYSLNETIKIC